jgi:hypothetical protein
LIHGNTSLHISALSLYEKLWKFAQINNKEAGDKRKLRIGNKPKISASSTVPECHFTIKYYLPQEVHKINYAYTLIESLYCTVIHPF